jgi:uroporphyrinogen decarboxylase
MTNHDRAAAALQRKIPDKVPLFELVIDPGVIEGICPGYSYSDFVEKYDFDIVLTGTPSSNYRMDLIEEKSRTYRDEWGVVRRFSDQTVPFPMEGPIKNEEDLAHYTPPDPLDQYRYSMLKELIQKFKGQRMIGMHVHDALSYPAYLRGMDNLLMDLIEHPTFAHELIDMGVNHTKALITNACELGADLFVFGDDYAGNTGPIMSPRHFKEFFLPGMKSVVQTAKKLGAYTIKHTDGNINSIIEMIISTGIDGIHPLDPEAGMSIMKVKERFGKQVCVIGNIDTGKILTESNPHTVSETVRRTIQEIAPGGGFVIASANSIHSHVKPENYSAMLKASRMYGDYRHLGTLG